MTERKRPRGVHKDNVIYYNFGAKRDVEDLGADDVVVLGGAMDRTSARTLTPQLPEILRTYPLEITDGGRVRRGREYYRDAMVVAFDVREGVLVAEVAGSQNEPFTVTISFPYRSPERLGQIGQMLADSPVKLRKMQEGEFTEDVLELLVKQEHEAFGLRCDCPDSQYCCKHLVAVFLKAADYFFAHPMAIFELRGLNFIELQQQALRIGQQRGVENAQGSEDLFWRGKPLPDLPNPAVAPALDDSDLNLLHKALAEVSFATVDTLRAVSELEDLYYELTHLE
ncbi:SWIM zinc finger family protein [Corynebacterium sp. 153RC1]|uniref:SWIM zinc finger family protein n=1 Tax=unclassified Corynebacterium TaxID=2624378 RepID=UPI00211BDFD6|nr:MULTISPECIES: SWIM zinc finger family protein [unclassified Corynebacterium]MCQ9352005.1 SWIM zinc finger family protein [Corynebacterium sp. 209RC1]MCQ9353754.1 SWIM zinc finger family protein [Corynebacterium sp. 1222RC1]MCQ9356262.1 SWIM zinc finger family protein [Corynebacterium sp. 122RC1]MCQ9358364.1 SWIM zinc finger family protein [Corynebacterium sp. 142RC1]MCQ9360901.1 SWIM zinc finger family protein [Corynebacterium sp. 153RC1]